MSRSPRYNRVKHLAKDVQDIVRQERGYHPPLARCKELAAAALELYPNEPREVLASRIFVNNSWEKP